MKAMIAMSGGVDSSVAAYLVQAMGYECIGATMRLCGKDLLFPFPVADPALDAQAVAEKLKISFESLDSQDDFRRLVAMPFIQAYEEGLTPNPCINCNRSIKFGLLLNYALSRGCDKLVTGHYARIRQDENTGRYLLCKAADEAKDQSYFLACLDQDQLAHSLFPLGEYTKEQVRAIAAEQGFLNAKKRDSQDICFVPDGDYVAFMERITGKNYPQGDYVDEYGKVLGQHKGAVHYTLGQRKGLGIALGQPAYVCAKDMEKNTVTLGPESALFATSLIADGWNWISIPAPEQPIRVQAKARYRHIPQNATVHPGADGTAQVVFEQPQRAITPGQTVVLYDGDYVVGSGTIRRVL